MAKAPVSLKTVSADPTDGVNRKAAKIKRYFFMIIPPFSLEVAACAVGQRLTVRAFCLAGIALIADHGITGRAFGTAGRVGTTAAPCRASRTFAQSIFEITGFARIAFAR